MSEREQKTGKGARDGTWDRALRDWPSDERATEGDALARAVVERIARGDAAASSALDADEDVLLASPLARSTEDGDEPASPNVSVPSERQRLRERQSLRELAKMAQSLTPASGSSELVPSVQRSRAAEAASARGDDDSGIVDLAAAAKADPEATARAQTTPLASHDLFEASASRAAAPPSKRPPAAAAESAPDLPGDVREESRPSNASSKAKRSVVIALFMSTTIALGSAAAAAFFFVKTRDAASVQTVAVASATGTPAAASPAPPLPSPTPSAVATVLAADPNSLPPASSAAPLADNAGATTKPGGAKPASTDKREDGRLAKADSAPSKGSPKTAGEDGHPSGGADLGSAIKREIGGDDTREKTPAAALTGAGDVPQRPSQGAVTGALGSVLPEARRCLGPDDPVSRASIVFSSSGSVQSVSVAGPASGKPTEACIKDALSKAKVQPFAEPSYSASITVRHP